MRLSKQRRAISTWGLQNLRFAVIGLPTVKPISLEIEPETMKDGIADGMQEEKQGNGALSDGNKWEAGVVVFFMWGFKESDAEEIENMPSYYFKEQGN